MQKTFRCLCAVLAVLMALTACTVIAFAEEEETAEAVEKAGGFVPLYIGLFVACLATLMALLGGYCLSRAMSKADTREKERSTACRLSLWLSGFGTLLTYASVLLAGFAYRDVWLLKTWHVALHIVNAILLYVLMFLLLYAPAKRAIKARAEQDRIEEEALKEKKTALLEQEKQIAELRERVEQEMQEKRRLAEQAIADYTENEQQRAKLRATKVVNDAQRALLAERTKMLDEAKAQVAQMTREQAESVLRTAGKL